MSTQPGYPWEVWNDRMPPRKIATGHCMSEDGAVKEVERQMADHLDALFAVVVYPDLSGRVCRRGRVPGTLHWYRLDGWSGDMPGSPAVVSVGSRL